MGNIDNKEKEFAEILKLVTRTARENHNVISKEQVELAFSELELPSRITAIGEQAFLACRNLTSIEIPGKVTSIGIRTTCIEDPGGNVKIINNSDMNNVLNRSDHSSRAVSAIGIPYETDLEALEKKIPAMMDGIFERHSDIMLSKPVYLGVDALSDSSVDLKFVAEVNDKDIYGAARALNRELFLEFRKAGVEVAFPQVDVHQK